MTGTNAGHDRGYASLFTRLDATTDTAETIYYQTDKRETVDPAFTLVEGVDKLPQLAATGHIQSLVKFYTRFYKVLDCLRSAEKPGISENGSGRYDV